MDIFEKYKIDYTDTGINKDIIKDRIELQWILYNVMQAKTDTDKEGIKELIKMISVEIEHQYVRKEHMENRSGFILALWGVIIGFVFNNKDLLKIDINFDDGCVGVLQLLIILFGVLSMTALFLCLKSIGMKHFGLEDRKTNYLCALENMDMFHVRTLEILMNIWSANEKAVNGRGKMCTLSLVLVFIFALLIMVTEIIIKTGGC